MASNSKKRRRVLGVSCILAALIIASSSFAWFTSKDEVTNRLSASSDYGVSIVESFAPPKNWLPGEEVNKDTYSTNTGSIAAFVRNDVSGVLTLTKEDVVAGVTWKADEDPDEGTATLTAAAADNASVTFADLVELSTDEKYLSVEAGSYLAYKPAKSAIDLGRQIVKYPSGSDATYVYTNGANTYALSQAEFTSVYGADPADNKTPTTSSIPARYGTDLNSVTAGSWKKVEAKDDFTPDVEGLYVFRRTIDVDMYGMEDFTYAAYYFKDGKYYKITDLEVTQDDTDLANQTAHPVDATDPDTSFLDRAGDGNEKDGQLSYAKGNFVKEVTTVYEQPEKFEYDAQNNRLVATYLSTDNSNNSYEDEAKALDQAEHNLAKARTALDRAIRDNESANTQSDSHLNTAAQLTNELLTVQARLNKIGSDSTSGTLLYDLDVKNDKLATDETADGNNPTDLSADNGKIKNDEARTEAAWNALYGSGTNAYVTNTSVTGMKSAGLQNDRYSDVTGEHYGECNNVPNTADSDSTSLLAKLKAAETAVENARNTTYEYSKFEAYVNELYAAYPDKLLATDTYDDVLRKLNYNELTNTSKVNFVAGTDLHKINELTWKYIKAKADFEEGERTLNSAIASYRNSVIQLGKSGTVENASPDTKETIGGKEITYTSKKVTGDTAGVLGSIDDLTAEKQTLEAKKAKLEEAINAEITAANTSLKVDGQPGSNTAAQTLAAALTAYQDASKEYDEKLIAYNAKKKAYENNKELKIYINLSDDVVTYGGVANKWQLLNTDLDDLYSRNPKGVTDYTADGKKDTAVFYYTSILEGGETSAKLIDSVELDSAITQDMYKYFDYDLNVALKSAQATYDTDNETILTKSTPTELNATATLSNPKDINTALTWAANTPQP